MEENNPLLDRIKLVKETGDSYLEIYKAVFELLKLRGYPVIRSSTVSFNDFVEKSFEINTPIAGIMYKFLVIIMLKKIFYTIMVGNIPLGEMKSLLKSEYYEPYLNLLGDNRTESLMLLKSIEDYYNGVSGLEHTPHSLLEEYILANSTK